MFESFANSERYKTLFHSIYKCILFESFANSERYKTFVGIIAHDIMFESFANSERYKTTERNNHDEYSLRALLIQKDTKLIEFQNPTPFV